MGGYGSGRRWSGKDTTSDYLRLDIRRLQQRGLLDRYADFSWQWTLNDEPYANIRIRSELDRCSHIAIDGEAKIASAALRRASRADGIGTVVLMDGTDE